MVNFPAPPGSQATSGAVGPLIIVVVESLSVLAYPSFLGPENPRLSRQGRELGAGCRVAGASSLQASRDVDGMQGASQPRASASLCDTVTMVTNGQ